MVHKPGHLQFDDSAPKRTAPGAPRPIDFAGIQTENKAGRGPETHQPESREPGALFGDAGSSMAPAMDYARSAFPDLVHADPHGLERKIRQLIPWREEIVSAWSSKALDENASVTIKAAQLINRYAEYGVSEVVEKALSLSRRSESGFLNRLFLRGKVISGKPALKVARSQLTQLIADCSRCISELEPLGLQLRSGLAALASAYGAMPKPREHAVESAIHARRLLLQQSIHQSELTGLQLQELKQQMAAQLANVEQLLTVTIPAFEIADAGK